MGKWRMDGWMYVKAINVCTWTPSRAIVIKLYSLVFFFGNDEDEDVRMNTICC